MLTNPNPESFAGNARDARLRCCRKNVAALRKESNRYRMHQQNPIVIGNAAVCAVVTQSGKSATTRLRSPACRPYRRQ